MGGSVPDRSVRPLLRRSSGVTALALALAALPASALEPGAAPSCANQPVQTEFEEGAWCFEKKRWHSAIPWWIDAIAEDAAADADKIMWLYGRLARYSYLPYFYLGRSYYEIEDCEAAVEFFDKSEKQNQIQAEDSLYGRLKRQRAECQGKERSAAIAGGAVAAGRHGGGSE